MLNADMYVLGDDGWSPPIEVEAEGTYAGHMWMEHFMDGVGELLGDEYTVLYEHDMKQFAQITDWPETRHGNIGVGIIDGDDYVLVHKIGVEYVDQEWFFGMIDVLQIIGALAGDDIDVGWC